MRTFARSVGLLGGVGLFVMAGVGVLGVAEAAKKKEKAAEKPPVQAEAPAPDEGKVVYTFENEDKLKEFAKLWHERQMVVVRMSVLRSYWDEEQAALAGLNNQFATDYKLDTTKNYTFDAKRRAIIERPLEEPQAAAPQQAPDASTGLSKP